MTNKYQIRNRDGHLLCKLFFQEERWLVQIKNHTCYSMLSLSPDGTFVIVDQPYIKHPVAVKMDEVTKRRMV